VGGSWRFQRQGDERKIEETKMWADAQRDGRPALYEGSLIPFLVPRRKVWFTPTARVPCSNAANIGERKTWTQSEFCGCKVNFARGKIPLGARAPENVYIMYQPKIRPTIVQFG